MRNAIFSCVAGVILSLGVFLVVEPAWATTATWLTSPESGDWNDAANWSPMVVPNGPNDVARFQTSNQGAVSLSSDIEVNEIAFDSSGNSFGVYIGAPLTLAISGLGVTNNSGTAQNFVVTGTVRFSNGARVGGLLSFYDYGAISFNDSTNAGSAVFTNNANTSVVFSGSSSASSATMTNSYSSSIAFFESANAGSANVTLQTESSFPGAVTLFYDTSSAANAQFIINSGSYNDNDVHTGAGVTFFNSSTAGSSTLVANGGFSLPFGNSANPGRIMFSDTSSGENAMLIANTGSSIQEGGTIIFGGNSTGSMAQVKVFGNGNLDITGHDSPGVAVGSIEGDGYIILGSKQLTVGANNLSTTFGGQIQDHLNPDVSLVKVGTGTLTFTSSNSYTGGTSIESGVVQGSHDLVFGGAPQFGGFVSVGPNGTLTLDSGATNNYIVDRSSLMLATGSVVNLNFTGPPDRLRSLIVDGVTQPPGLYGSNASSAVVELPQFTGSGTIVAVAKAVSRLTHGSAGPFDVDLPFAGSPGIECRTGSGNGGDYQVVVTFYNPVTFSYAVIASGNAQVADASGSGTNTVVVNLTGVANAQTISLGLANLNDGTGPASFFILMSILIGDVNGNGTVNASDVVAVKAQLGQPATASNFRADVNPNGIVNASDVVKVKTLLGTSLP
jgi:autotransporter-associated beta strand protein